LLRLPAELRNAVWEYVLVEDGEIRITPDLKQPPLLLACRQVRGETLKLWYLGYYFDVNIYNLDAGLINAWAAHTEKMGSAR